MPGLGAIVVQLGVEAQGAVIENLQAIQPHVAAPILVAHVAHAHGDEGAAILGPGGEHGQFRQLHRFAL